MEGINRALGEPAVNAVKGGRKGGGAALTPAGRQLVQLYRAIEMRVQAVALLERRKLQRIVQPEKTSSQSRGQLKRSG